MFCYTEMPRCLVLTFGLLGGWTTAAPFFISQVEREQDKTFDSARGRDRAERLRIAAEVRETWSPVDLDAIRRRYMRGGAQPIPLIPNAEDGERIPAPATPFPTR